MTTGGGRPEGDEAAGLVHGVDGRVRSRGFAHEVVKLGDGGLARARDPQGVGLRVEDGPEEEALAGAELAVEEGALQERGTPEYVVEGDALLSGSRAYGEALGSEVAEPGGAEGEVGVGPAQAAASTRRVRCSRSARRW